MAEVKMTKAMRLAEILELVKTADADSFDIEGAVSFIEKEIQMLEAKAEKAKARQEKVKAEGDELRATVQAVLTDENADCAQLIKEASENFQSTLDTVNMG